MVNLPVDIYQFKINNRNTRKRCEICSKSTIKITERRQVSFWSEAVARRFSVKKVFLEILQNSQVFSCEFCEISKNSFYYRTPPVAASTFQVLLFLLLRECSFPAVALKETLNLAFYLSNHPFEAWNFSTWSSCAKLIAFSLRIVPLISKLFIRTLLNQSK